MKKVKKFWPFILIVFISLLFFWPIFKGEIPFPGDLLVSNNPYSAQSYHGYAPAGYPNKAQGPDVITEIYPWRYFSVNQLKSFTIPFWNPHNFSGNIQMADFQTAVFYPLNFLYFIFPFNLSWTLIIMFQPILAALFMYLFLKKGIGLKDFASFIGGVSFAFCSYMTVWIEYGNIASTLLWLPLALLFTKQYVDKSNFKHLLGLVLSLTFSVLAGYIQGVFYIYVLCFFYYTFLSLGIKGSFRKYKQHLFFLTSLVLPLFLTAFQILPTLNIFASSTRSAYSLSQIENILSPIVNLITVIIPDFFGNPATRNYWIDGTYIERVMYPGTVILFFAVFLFTRKTNLLEKKFFGLVSIISLILATNFPLVKFFYLIPIPVISTTIPTRELSIFIFSIIVLGAVGLNYFCEEKNISKKYILFYLLIFILIWGTVLGFIKFLPSLSQNLEVTLRNLIIPTVLFIGIIVSIFFKKINKNLMMLTLSILVIVDLFFFFNKITPFAPTDLTYPKTPIISYLKEIGGINRIWGYGSAYMPSNFQSVDGTFSPEGNDPLHISRYGELIVSSKDGKFPKMLPRPDANIAPGYGTDDLKTNYTRKRVLDLLGVKYILHKQDLVDAWYQTDVNTFPATEYALVNKIYPWQVYENKNVLPRFFLANKFVIAKDKFKAMEYIYDSNIDLKNTLILEKQPVLQIDSNSTGEAKLISYKPNNVIIETRTKGNSLLFLSDNYYPEWKVKIDGKESDLLIADYSFRAVALPSGVHTIEFFYSPKMFIIGLMLGLFTLLSIIVYAIIRRNRQRKQ